MTELEKKQANDLLTARINAKYREVEGLARSTVEAAIELGGMLVEKRESLERGEWLPWMKENFEGSKSHAYNFINLYENRDKLLDGNFQRVGSLTLRDALKAIAAPKEEGDRSLADELMDEWEDPPEVKERFAALPEKDKLLKLRNNLLQKYMFFGRPDEPDAHQQKVVGQLDQLDFALRPIDLPEGSGDRELCEENLTYKQMHRTLGELCDKRVIQRMSSDKVFERFMLAMGASPEEFAECLKDED